MRSIWYVIMLCVTGFSIRAMEHKELLQNPPVVQIREMAHQRMQGPSFCEEHPRICRGLNVCNGVLLTYLVFELSNYAQYVCAPESNMLSLDGCMLTYCFMIFAGYYATDYFYRAYTNTCLYR